MQRRRKKEEEIKVQESHRNFPRSHNFKPEQIHFRVGNKNDDLIIKNTKMRR